MIRIQLSNNKLSILPDTFFRMNIKLNKDFLDKSNIPYVYNDDNEIKCVFKY